MKQNPPLKAGRGNAEAAARISFYPARPGLVVALALVLALSLTCKQHLSDISHPPVVYDPSSGTVTIPKSNIICRGVESYESAVIPDTGLALVVTSDSNTYFYSPLQGSLDALTDQTSKDALLRAILCRLPAKAAGENTTTSGIRGKVLMNLSLEFTNQCHRWAAVRRLDANGVPTDSAILPPATFFDYNLWEIIQRHWSEAVKINYQPADTLDFVRAPADQFETYGSVTKVALLLPTAKAWPELERLLPANYLTALKASWNRDSWLVTRVNLAEGLDLVFFVADLVLAGTGKDIIGGVLDKPALEGLCSLVHLSLNQVITSSKTEKEFVSTGSGDILKTIVTAVLELVQSSARAPARQQLRSSGEEESATLSIIGTILLLKTVVSLCTKAADQVAGVVAELTHTPYDAYALPANEPPAVPNVPGGPTSGQPGAVYEYTAATFDPEGDDITYQFDDGTGNQTTWSPFTPNGQPITVSLQWNSGGSYVVKVKAKVDCPRFAGHFLKRHMLVPRTQPG